MLRRALCLALLALCAAAPADDARLPEPATNLSDPAAGFQAQLDCFVQPDNTLLVFRIGETGRPVVPLPPLAVQGAALDQVVRDSPLAQAFAAHGYALALTGMNRTEIQPVPALGNRRLPTEITIMLFEATRRHVAAGHGRATLS